jgi:hypothetical protein
MPYRPKSVELPEWILDLSEDDGCLRDVLTEAWVAAQHARIAISRRGSKAPRTCTGELESAEAILDAIRTGRVQPSKLAQKAAQAVRKFDSVRQCASFLERDDSPRFARERNERRIRLLGAREGSVLARRGAH